MSQLLRQVFGKNPNLPPPYNTSSEASSSRPQVASEVNAVFLGAMQPVSDDFEVWEDPDEDADSLTIEQGPASAETDLKLNALMERTLEGAGFDFSLSDDDMDDSDVRISSFAKGKSVARVAQDDGMEVAESSSFETSDQAAISSPTLRTHFVEDSENISLETALTYCHGILTASVETLEKGLVGTGLSLDQITVGQRGQINFSIFESVMESSDPVEFLFMGKDILKALKEILCDSKLAGTDLSKKINYDFFLIGASCQTRIISGPFLKNGKVLQDPKMHVLTYFKELQTHFPLPPPKPQVSTVRAPFGVLFESA